MVNEKRVNKRVRHLIEGKH